MMNKNQKICLMVAIFSVVILFISGTSFAKQNAASMPSIGDWFTGTKIIQRYPTYRSEQRTNYIAIFSTGLLVVSVAGFFILED